MIDLSFNYPSVPGQDELLQRCMTEVLSDSTLDLAAPRPYFGDPADAESVRAALVGSQSATDGSSLALTCSGQSALAAAIAAICHKPGMCFAAERWSFNQFIQTLPIFGAVAAAVEMDDGGMVPYCLARVCEQQKVDAVYTMPSFHNPLGAVMSVERREEIVAIARRHDLRIIEDDAYAFLDSGSLPSIRSLAPERTLQVFSLSKLVTLSLRLGALVVPKSMSQRVADYMRFAGIPAHPVATAAAARIAREGHLPQLAAAKRTEAVARFEIAKAALGQRAQQLHPHGWHILLATPEGIPGTQFAELARNTREVAVTPAAVYRFDGRDDPLVRVSFGGERDRAVLAEGIKRLAEMVAPHE